MKRLAFIPFAALVLFACQDAAQPSAVEMPYGPAAALHGPLCATPPSGLVSWWPGDTDASDIQGTHDGVLTGDAAAGVSGKVAGAFSLDGMGDFVDLSAHRFSLNFSPSATFDFWVQSSTDVSQVIFAIGDGTINNVLVMGIGDGFTGGIQNPLITVGRKVRGLTPFILSYATATRTELFDGSFHHIAITFDGNEVKIYLDGVAKPVSVVSGTNTGVYGNILGVTKAYIGADDNGGPVTFFDGLIDEFELFNRALSASEIQDIFDAGSAGKCKPGMPDADANGPYTGVEGGPAVAFDGCLSSDPDVDALTFDWTFGDGGTASSTPTPSHTYANDGVFDVTLTVSDGVWTDIDATTATISNVVPMVNLGPDVTILEGETFVQSGSFTDPGADTWTAQVNYDDGAGFESLTLTGTGFDLSHTYANPGDKSVEVRVFDDDGFGSSVVTVTVSLQQATQNIIDDVQALVDGEALTERDSRGLIRKLEQTIRKLDQGKVTSAISKLQDFIVQVTDFIDGGKLTTAEGEPLIEAAQAIIDSLGG
jgi:PKD repeat protein